MPSDRSIADRPEPESVDSVRPLPAVGIPEDHDDLVAARRPHGLCVTTRVPAAAAPAGTGDVVVSQSAVTRSPVGRLGEDEDTGTDGKD